MDVKEEDEDMEDQEDGNDDDDGTNAAPETVEIRELAHRLEKFG